MTEPTDERIQRIRETAALYDGRFLLRHRYPGAATRPPSEKTDLDHDYDACAVLVARGEAVWLPHHTPGIRIVREPRPTAPKPPEMALDAALHILAEAHTEADHLTGYRVHTTAARMVPDALWAISQTDYIKAWGAVRRHLHLQVDPPEDKP